MNFCIPLVISANSTYWLLFIDLVSKLDDGRTVKVTGSFAEFQRFAENNSSSGSGTQKVAIYEDEIYTINFNERVQSVIKDFEWRKVQGIGVGKDWNSMDCHYCKTHFTNKAAEISKDFKRDVLEERVAEQEKMNEYNNRYDLKWEIIPAEDTGNASTPTPVPTTIPAPTPVPVIAEDNTTTSLVVPVASSIPAILSTPARGTGGVIPAVPAAVTAISSLLPDIASTAQHAALASSNAPVNSPMLAAGDMPSIQTPTFYVPAEEIKPLESTTVPATTVEEDAPSIQAPTFYYPGLW